MLVDDNAVLTVIGAGPIGSLLALVLAQEGHRVQVFERRPDMRKQSISAGRSINLAVSARGLHALAAVGLREFVLAQAVPMLGRMLHTRDGDLSFFAYGRDNREYINSMSRGELNKLLMTQAEQTGRVQIHFGQRLAAYNVETQEATFYSEHENSERTVATPVIFGSDGSGSVLRVAIAEATKTRVSQEALTAGYKELTMTAAAAASNGAFAGKFRLDPGALHIWPRGKFMLIALGNPDGSFTCTLFLAFVATVDSPGFDGLQDAASVSAFFNEYFSDVIPHMPDFVEQFLEAPTGSMVTVKTPIWSHGSALLLGDAAHAVVPFFGQGMNCGFEDVTILSDMLKTCDTWPELFAKVGAARKPQADAIADMAVENFTEMRDKVADPVFVLHRAVEAEVSKRMGGRYLSRYQLVTFSRVPYQVAREAGAIQAEILEQVCRGVTALSEVDLDLTEKRMTERLLPLLAQYLG